MSELYREFEQILKEATSQVEQSLAIEGWTKLGNSTMSDLAGASRSEYVKKSRYLYHFDPLAKQSIRLWTDYTFGSGLAWNSDNEAVKTALDKFWNNPKNRSVLSAKGQRKSSDKSLTDGEVFFALFLGPSGEVTIRWIDPLEITEIITDPDDVETVRYYKREWINAQNQTYTSYYRSHTNIEDTETPDNMGKMVQASDDTQDAVVYHVALNTIGQRGNPLLLPVIGWIEQYRLFLAARIAIVRALARFAWATKTKGGAAAVAAVKAAVDGKYPQAGSTLVTNEAVQVDPIRTDTGSSNAATDGRMLKLQICSGVGIPEQYYGDIATGNLATAKTVELPMLKQFGANQQIWSDVWIDIFNIVLDHNGVAEDDRFVDVDMPEIAPEDQVAAVTAIGQIITSFPDLAEVDEVIKQALMNIGLNNVDEIIKKLKVIIKKKESMPKPTEILPQVLQNGQQPGEQEQPVQGQPPTQEAAEVRAIRALIEIRDKIDDGSKRN